MFNGVNNNIRWCTLYFWHHFTKILLFLMSPFHTITTCTQLCLKMCFWVTLEKQLHISKWFICLYIAEICEASLLGFHYYLLFISVCSFNYVSSLWVFVYVYQVMLPIFLIFSPSFLLSRGSKYILYNIDFNWLSLFFFLSLSRRFSLHSPFSLHQLNVESVFL